MIVSQMYFFLCFFDNKSACLFMPRAVAFWLSSLDATQCPGETDLAHIFWNSLHSNIRFLRRHRFAISIFNIMSKAISCCPCLLKHELAAVFFKDSVSSFDREFKE